MTTRCGVLATVCMLMAACTPTPRSADTAAGVTAKAPNPLVPGIVFRNEMSSAFRLTRALFALNDVVIFNAQARGGESLPSEITVLPGALSPGDHVLKVLLRFRGHAAGVSSHVASYGIEVKSSRRFTVDERQPLRVEAIAFEQPDTRTPLKARPAVAYAWGIEDDLPENDGSQAAQHCPEAPSWTGASRRPRISHDAAPERWAASLYGYQAAMGKRSSDSLGAARHAFARYIDGMHNRIHPHFGDSFLAGLDQLPSCHALNDPKLHSVLEIAVDQHGRIARMGVIEGSGVTAFDIGALEATLAAVPFGKPPSEIISADGLVYVHWEFYRDPNYSCSMFFARPYLRAPLRRAL